MADIRIRELPTASPAVPTDFVAIDNGSTRKVAISDLVDVGRPLASQAEAEAGTEPTKAMTPLTTAQAITALGATQFASSAQGVLADSALQPAAIGVTVQAHSGNLDTLSGTTPGAAGLAILADSVQADVRDYLDVPSYAETRTALKALDTSKDTIVYLKETGRQGIFQWTSGDFSAQITADTEEGVYIKADAVAATAGAWVRYMPDGAIHPEWFGAQPGNTGFDSGIAINKAFDLAFAVASIKRVRFTGGEYYSSVAIRPFSLQSGSGNFDAPFDIEMNGVSALVATGSGHAADDFFLMRNTADQRSFRYLRIVGSLNVMNDGDWGNGVKFIGMNFSYIDRIQVGRLGTDGSTEERFFSSRQFQNLSNNGKGGIWNTFGDVEVFGGTLPFFEGPIANSNKYSSIVAMHGTDGAGALLNGDRTQVGRISVEAGLNQTPRYLLQTAGIEIEISNFEIEGVGPDNTTNPSYMGALWVSAGSVVGTGCFHALSGSGKPLIFKGTNSAGRISRFDPSATTPNKIVREVWGGGAGPQVVSQAVSVGVNTVYPARTTLVDGNGAAIVTQIVKVTNNSNQTVSVNAGHVSYDGTITDIVSTGDDAIVAAGSYTYTAIEISQAQATGKTTTQFFGRARTSAATVTGTVLFEVVANVLG